MSGRKSAPALLEPYFLFLILAAVALGTVSLAQSARLALVWTALALIGILYQGVRPISWRFSLADVTRGALVGLVIGVPLLAFLASSLQVYTERLFGTGNAVMLYYQACFVAAPAEEFFFRGVVQSRRGTSVSTALYAATALIYFLGKAPLLGVFFAFVAMGILGFLFSYVADRYGLAAATACHVTMGVLLQVMPSLVAAMRMILA
jgi:membrane protease YdiL (CAAX protease family)